MSILYQTVFAIYKQLLSLLFTRYCVWQYRWKSVS